MPDEELELAAVPAEDAPAPGNVTDEEFDRWVARSQADTDAALEGWDTSVEFERARYGDGNMTMDVDVVDADILNEDGTVATDEDVASWQALAARVRAGEELGPELRRTALGTDQCVNGPDCAACAAINVIDPLGPGMWALEVAARFVADNPRHVVMSMPTQRGRSAAREAFDLFGPGAAPFDFIPWWPAPDPVPEARRNLELMGFRIVEDRPAPGTMFSILGGQLVPPDPLEARIRRELAARPVPPLLPTRHSSAWSIREIMGPIASQRRATFRTL